jgi:predicted secreted protein with PEFG-CTERM motif
MKSKLIGSPFVVLTLIVGIMAFAPSAFADASVTMTKGSAGGQTCVTTNNCFDPAQVNVTPGTEVDWKNADTASHTVTSGMPSDNTTGTIFDSSLVKAGGEFKFTFNDAGTFDYYCQVHPWMTGQVIVGTASATTSEPTTTTNPTADNNTAVPEFGSVASLVLVIAIISVVAVTAKTRGFLKL